MQVDGVGRGVCLFDSELDDWMNGTLVKEMALLNVNVNGTNL